MILTTRNDEKRTILWNAIVNYDENGNVMEILGFGNDITERKKAQQEAMRTAHLASIGELAAGVAHEINNPITGIINCTQIIIDDMKETHQDTEVAERVLNAGKRIGKIVKNLLAFARKTDEKTIKTNVENIINDSFDPFQKQLQKDGITIKKAVMDKPPLILAQPQKLQQVFINLLSNARHALNRKFPEPHNDKVLFISAEPLV